MEGIRRRPRDLQERGAGTRLYYIGEERKERP